MGLGVGMGLGVHPTVCVCGLTPCLCRVQDATNRYTAALLFTGGAFLYVLRRTLAWLRRLLSARPGSPNSAGWFWQELSRALQAALAGLL